MNDFETAVVNEPSVFEPLKFYCMSAQSRNRYNSGIVLRKVGILTLYTYFKYIFDCDVSLKSKTAKSRQIELMVHS